MVATTHRPGLVDSSGSPLMGSREAKLQELVASLRGAKRDMMRAKYDAAQTHVGNENHWANADNLDPHTVASLAVRKKLRSRSRYEIIENNPYLKGAVLTIANDFIGSGPKLQITDRRISKDRRRVIERRWARWAKVIKLRQKLWRLRVSKLTDGESFLRAYPNRANRSPMVLDFQVLETDRISAESVLSNPRSTAKLNEIDGVRFDLFENPTDYHILDAHPGGRGFLQRMIQSSFKGKWVKAKFMVHWFRQDRGWLRGIPEATPSLPLCAILRRYTLAVCRHAETAADFTALIESDAPANVNPWTDGNGTQTEDDPFDVFPIEMGMVTNLPWGYKMKQLNPVPLGTQYDVFVGALLREITRPLLLPFNMTAGTSKDSNMASAVVDANIYKTGQTAERLSCEEIVLDHILDLFWGEAVFMPGFLGDSMLAADPTFRDEPPEHVWRWDKIGLDHTDPAKVQNALKTAHDKGFLTDRDIQETYYNRDVDDWREQIKEDIEFRKSVGLSIGEDGAGEEDGKQGAGIGKGDDDDDEEKDD